ncbi:MAG TPA: putative sporulation protein YtxC [Bacillales bacterium]|nr:putative sporulation protein YtxC [Bacillales bacterium]
MIKIEMRNEREAASLFYRFQSTPFTKGLEASQQENLLQIHCSGSKQQISHIAFLLSEHVICEHEERMLLTLIYSTFYFQDADEQEQILAVAKSIIQGEKPEIPGVKQLSSRSSILFDTFYHYLLDEKTLPFESFLRFRLKPYRECLLRYVEMAIDEYKLEQDYQTFVETLRKLLKQRGPLLDTVHVVYNGEFFLYDQHDNRIDEMGLRKRLEPIFQTSWGLHSEPSLLLTLIGIAPKKIFLYTDETDIGMIQTIQNVFQERLEIFPSRRSHFHS